MMRYWISRSKTSRGRGKGKGHRTPWICLGKLPNKISFRGHRYLEKVWEGQQPTTRNSVERRQSLLDSNPQVNTNLDKAKFTTKWLSTVIAQPLSPYLWKLKVSLRLPQSMDLEETINSLDLISLKLRLSGNTTIPSLKDLWSPLAPRDQIPKASYLESTIAHTRGKARVRWTSISATWLC